MNRGREVRRRKWEEEKGCCGPEKPVGGGARVPLGLFPFGPGGKPGPVIPLGAGDLSVVSDSLVLFMEFVGWGRNQKMNQSHVAKVLGHNVLTRWVI